MVNTKKNYLDPLKMDNYNKFLIAMDNPMHNPMHNKPVILINENKNKTNVENNENNEYKNIIDSLIDKINANFKNNTIDSSNVTGYRIEDSINVANERINPNNYKSIIKKHFKRENSCCSSRNNDKEANLKIMSKETIKETIKEKLKIEIKETINIDTEINNISDILKLIEDYKDEPSIKYNIDISSLHKIKEPLQELNNMIGMKELKNNIVYQILYFVQNLHINKNSSGDFMHTVIYGPPGTGKTEVAKLLGNIYSKIGILDKGTFKKVTRSDLIAGYLGQTSLKTRDVIKEALGGVLFIDEAYALGNSEKRDSFSKECIDTLCEALSDNKDNLMVIIAGYESDLKECFFSYNQGLESRFTWKFKTDNYDAEDLYSIFIKKVKDIGWHIHENANITSDWFKTNIDYFSFFGRDMETLLAKTKIAHSKRVFCKSDDEKKKLTLQDLERGLEIYLKNSDIKNKKDSEYFKKQLHNSIYC